MGLSFHYKGALKNPQSLKKMIEEVTDIAQNNQWNYQIFDEQFPSDGFTAESNPDAIYGICFSPPNCGVVCLTFFSNGKLSSYGDIEPSTIPKDEFDEDYISVKTQFAGREIHKQLMVFFDYMSKKYFENFDLNDEGNYWESKNEQLLEDTFTKYSNFIEGFDSLLENIPIGENESVEDYLLRIAEMNRKKNNDTENDNVDQPDVT